MIALLLISLIGSVERNQTKNVRLTKVQLIDENGNSQTKEFFHVFARESGYNHDFNKIGNIVELKPQKILEAECYLFDAYELWESVKKAMEKDPYCIARKL